jgi:membrane associated rhomboid family serine protease
MVFIGLWIATQILHVEIFKPDGVAYWAHLGGAVVGAVLIIVMKQPDVRLLDCVWPSKISVENRQIDEA